MQGDGARDSDAAARFSAFPPDGVPRPRLAVPRVDGAPASPVPPRHPHAGRLGQKQAFLESLLKIKLLSRFQSQTLNLREKTGVCVCSLQSSCWRTCLARPCCVSSSTQGEQRRGRNTWLAKLCSQRGAQQAQLCFPLRRGCCLYFYFFFLLFSLFHMHCWYGLGGNFDH